MYMSQSTNQKDTLDWPNKCRDSEAVIIKVRCLVIGRHETNDMIHFYCSYGKMNITIKQTLLYYEFLLFIGQYGYFFSSRIHGT